jgi:hypothetical protein
MEVVASVGKADLDTVELWDFEFFPTHAPTFQTFLSKAGVSLRTGSSVRLGNSESAVVGSFGPVKSFVPICKRSTEFRTCCRRSPESSFPTLSATLSTRYAFAPPTTDIPTARLLQFSMFRLGRSANRVPDCPQQRAA